MNTIYSPARLKLLLHCYLGDLETSEAVQFKWTLEEFAENRWIKRKPNTAQPQHLHEVYEMTPLGNAFVQMILDLEPPHSAFLDHQGRLIRLGTEQRARYDEAFCPYCPKPIEKSPFGPFTKLESSNV